MDTDDKRFGLCAYAKLRPLHIHRAAIFEQWEHFSGNDRYPVPSPKGVLAARLIYVDNMYNLYDRSTEYGRLRIDLATYRLS